MKFLVTFITLVTVASISAAPLLITIDGLTNVLNEVLSQTIGTTDGPINYELIKKRITELIKSGNFIVGKVSDNINVDDFVDAVMEVIDDLIDDYNEEKDEEKENREEKAEEKAEAKAEAKEE